MKRKIALITGVTGQDGSYLSELLLKKGYIVYGLCRRVSYFNRNRIEHLRNIKRFKILYGDLNDYTSLESIMVKFPISMFCGHQEKSLKFFLQWYSMLNYFHLNHYKNRLKILN